MADLDDTTQEEPSVRVPMRWYLDLVEDRRMLEFLLAHRCQIDLHKRTNIGYDIVTLQVPGKHAIKAAMRGVVDVEGESDDRQ